MTKKTIQTILGCLGIYEGNTDAELYARYRKLLIRQQELIAGKHPLSPSHVQIQHKELFRKLYPIAKSCLPGNKLNMAPYYSSNKIHHERCLRHAATKLLDMAVFFRKEDIELPYVSEVACRLEQDGTRTYVHCDVFIEHCMEHMTGKLRPLNWWTEQIPIVFDDLDIRLLENGETFTDAASWEQKKQAAAET